MKEILLLIITLVISSGCAFAPTKFTTQGQATTPFSYKVWEASGGAGKMPPTIIPKDTWRAATKAHHKAHRLFNYKSDKYMTGKLDSWMVLKEVRPVTGDCEDFAILARQILKEAGITDARFVIAKVGDTFHMVLEYHGWILDNRMKEVVAKDHLDYRWVKLQDHDGDWKWL